MEIKKIYQRVKGWILGKDIDLAKIKLLEEKGITALF